MQSLSKLFSIPSSYLSRPLQSSARFVVTALMIGRRTHPTTKYLDEKDISIKKEEIIFCTCLCGMVTFSSAFIQAEQNLPSVEPHTPRPNQTAQCGYFSLMGEVRPEPFHWAPGRTEP